MERLVRLLENTAAISAEMHTEDKRRDEFYQHHGVELGGFPGVWNYCMKMADEFTAAEDKHKVKDGWIDSIFAYVVSTIEADTLPDNKDLYNLAMKAIQTAAKGA